LAAGGGVRGGNVAVEYTDAGNGVLSHTLTKKHNTCGGPMSVLEADLVRCVFPPQDLATGHVYYVSVIVAYKSQPDLSSFLASNPILC